MTYIKSPFNFVPVSKNVYFPDWAEQISHDVPFSDGISGVIHLKIKNHTPMFVRNGHTKMDAENNTAEYRSFSNVSNQYFIPATSIKGEVRNVLEILSFSKMDVDHNALFAQREWNNPELYSIKGNQLHILCGWLKRKGDGYEIINCGKPYRISHKHIDEYLGDNILERHFSRKSAFDLNKEFDKYDPKTATFKYHLLEEVNAKLENLSFEKDEKIVQSIIPAKCLYQEVVI
nr:RAMP superfamily CRISPR-associated protein [Segatella maculosa]